MIIEKQSNLENLNSIACLQAHNKQRAGGPALNKMIRLKCNQTFEFEMKEVQFR